MSRTNARTFAEFVSRRLQDQGFEAVFAGGCVRDFLMQKEAKDFDIATSALPEDVQKIFPRTVPVGEAFNVILVLSDDESDPVRIEVATFRTDIGIKDGRHPQKVEVATAREDVQRRDFTINGMLMNPSTGEIYDWVGGKKDLENRIIRSIGDPDLRIQEDYLRMLRAIRFTARLDFKMDEALQISIKKYASHIHKISAERIFDEMTKMLTGKNADKAMEWLRDLGLLQEIMPEALAMINCQQPAEYHPEGDVWVHTLLLLKQCESVEPALAWGCLLHDIGKPPTFSHEPPDRIRFNNHQNVGAEMAEAILKRLKASRSLTQTVVELTRDHLKFKDAPQMKPSTLKRFLRNPEFPLHLAMHKIDCMASHQDLTLYRFCEEKLRELPPDILKPEPLVTGHDLIGLGFNPSPLFKQILEMVETEQLEGRITTKDQAIALVKSSPWFDEIVR